MGLAVVDLDVSVVHCQHEFTLVRLDRENVPVRVVTDVDLGEEAGRLGS